MEERFHQKLKRLIHEYVLFGYRMTEKYPKHELYGLVSQDRRACVSVMLNYIEGYARHTTGTLEYMLKIAYGSLQESIYVRFLAKELGYISEDEYRQSLCMKEELARMFYSTMRGVKKKE
jgi:four helix bundle protein